MTNISNEGGDVITDLTDIRNKGLVWATLSYKVHQFLGRHKWALSLGKDNLNSSVSIKEIDQ